MFQRCRIHSSSECFQVFICSFNNAVTRQITSDGGDAFPVQQLHRKNVVVLNILSDLQLTVFYGWRDWAIDSWLVSHCFAESASTSGINLESPEIPAGGEQAGKEISNAKKLQHLTESSSIFINNAVRRRCVVCPRPRSNNHRHPRRVIYSSVSMWLSWSELLSKLCCASDPNKRHTKMFSP